MSRRRSVPRNIVIPESLRRGAPTVSPVARYLATHIREPTMEVPENQMRTGVSPEAERVTADRGTRYLDHVDRMEAATHKANLEAELARLNLENQKEYYRFRQRAGGAGMARRRRELRAARSELIALQRLATEGGKRTKNKEVELTNAANRANALIESYPELLQMGITTPDTWLIGKETRQQIGQEAAAAEYAQKVAYEMLRQRGKGDPKTVAASKLAASPSFNMMPESVRQKIISAVSEGLESTKASGRAKKKDYRDYEVGETLTQKGRKFVITMKDGKKFPRPL